MIQPLNGNVRVSRFTDNRLILVLTLVVLLLLTVIVDDKFDRPKVVHFYDGQKVHVVKTYETDVDSFLRSQSVSLAKGDVLMNSLSEPLTDSMEIRLIKVHEEIAVEEETIACRQVMRLCEFLAPGEAYELRRGRPGLKKNYYKVTYQNSTQKSRRLLGGIVCEKPSDRIIICGRDAFRANADTLVCRPLTFNVMIASDGNDRWARELRTSGALLGVVLLPPGLVAEGEIVELEGYGRFVARNEGPKTQAEETSLSSVKVGIANIRVILPRELAKNFEGRRRGVRITLI